MKKILLLVDDDKEEYELFCNAVARTMHIFPAFIFNSYMEIDDEIKTRTRMIFLDFNLQKMNGFGCLNKMKTSTSLRDIKVFSKLYLLTG